MNQTLQRIPAVKKRPKAKHEQMAADGEFTLIDKLLAEQKKLQTPVARFSEQHHRRLPDLADHYRSLIPLTAPGPGEQYAFEVSLDRCTGCKACVSACHSLNGLDDDEAWRDTGTMHAPGWQQTVTTACHHCADPGCLNGCPVGAYEKMPDTGIVRHLDDQCIGCSYCILKCPYDVPKYSKKRGIVRKCDMCHQRLAEGEAPACVQACPTEAIRIIKVPKEPGNFLPGAPDAAITLPTTRYVGREVPAAAIAADRGNLVPQHAHWPLVFMLSLTQVGIGLMAASTNTALLTVATVIFMAGMGASVLHLGQPLKAWRFFLGLRTSWLSREILAFSMFAPIPFVLLGLKFAPDFPFKEWVAGVAQWSVLPVGLAAVFTSVMIYVDTHRISWRFPLTAARFFGTVACSLALGHHIATPSPVGVMIFALAVLLKIAPERRVLRTGEDPDGEWSPDFHSARIQLVPLGSITRLRFTLVTLAVFVGIAQPWLALPLLLVAEVLERQLFFQSVHAPKMPGNFGPPKGH